MLFKVWRTAITYFNIVSDEYFVEFFFAVHDAISRSILYLQNSSLAPSKSSVSLVINLSN